MKTSHIDTAVKRRRALKRLERIFARLARLGGEQVTEAEVQQEIDAARRERRMRQSESR